MDTDRFNNARDETLIARHPWYVLAAVLLLLSAVAHQPLAFLAALFTLVIGIVPELWYRFALRHLHMRQRVSAPRAFFGETLTLAISVENQKLLPLPWLEIEDEIPEQLTLLTGRAQPSYKVNRVALVNTFSLWSFQRVTRRYRLRCSARGVYTFGPATVRSGDPFGWLMREERVLARETLLVYPLVAPIESFGLPPRHPFGERAMPRRLLEDPLRIAGAREYALGDDPRRIHWKATARAGELRSKIYEPSSQYRLLILLDINTYKESWMGLDPEIQELSIAVAASLAMWALDEGYAVGLLVNSLMMGLSGESASAGDEQAISSVAAAGAFIHRVRVPMGRGSGQREQLLSALGRLLPYFGSPMDALIDAERFTLPLGTTVVLVCVAAVLREETVESLVELRAHGAVVHLALTGDPESTVGAETYDVPVHRLGGREVWRELTRNAGDEDHDIIGRSTTSLCLD
jgi:uncharacterized protein (DUF58 family)